MILGGEGIVLKDRGSIYKPGIRSSVWWKFKQRLMLTVDMLACVDADDLIPWGDWGHRAMMAFAYTDPRTDVDQPCVNRSY